MAANFEHQVWAILPGKRKPVWVASFEPSRWQWAEKLHQILIDGGCTSVEVIEIELDEEENKLGKR